MAELGMTLAGSTFGLIAAWLSAQLVATLLYAIEARNATAFLAAPAVLIIVAVTACYLHTRRAATGSPLSALRYE